MSPIRADGTFTSLADDEVVVAYLPPHPEVTVDDHFVTLVKLELSNGSGDMYVNPKHVVSIRLDGAYAIVERAVGGDLHVLGTMEEVVAKLRGDSV